MKDSVKKLIVNMSLQTGEYVFDDGNQIKRMSIVDYEDLEDVTYNTENEIIEEYGFSEELVEQVDCFLYNGLKDIDEQNESNYTTKYLNMIAKDIERKPKEFKKQYKNRVTQIRKEILEDIGLELNYDVAIKGASEDLSLSDRLFMKKVAQKQQENGANVNIHFAYKDIEKFSNQTEQDDEISSDEVLEEDFEYSDYANSFNVAKPQQEEKYERTVVNSGDLQYEIRVDTSAFKVDRSKNEDVERKVEPYNIRTIKRDSSKFKRTETQETVSAKDKEQEVVIGENDIPDLKGDEKDKGVIDESEKTKYDIKVNESYVEAFAESYRAGENEEGKKKAEPYNISTRPKKDIFKKSGIDKDTPSAIVNTFVIDEFSIKDSEESEEAEIVDFETKKPKIKAPKTGEISMDEPKRKDRVQKFIRKFKDVKDKIQNKVFVSKPRFINKKFLITGAIGILAIAGVAVIGPKFISSMRANAEYTAENENKSSRNKEQENKVDKKYEYTKPTQDIKSGANAGQTNIINTQQTNATNAQKTSQGNKQQTVNTQKSKETQQANSTYKKADKTDSSTEYLKSIKVGTKMKINTGSYFETPEGLGKIGYFRAHKGKVKIISKIGIATKEGYTSISTSDVSLLELKQKYPDAEFSYHIVDEKGNIFGWMTSKSFSKYVSKDQIQMDDER